MRVRGQALAAHLSAEVVQLLLAQAALEESASVHSRSGMTLVVDLVASPFRVLAQEEVVEADLVKRGRRGVGRQMAADAGELVVRAQDHRDRVPANDSPYP